MHVINVSDFVKSASSIFSSCFASDEPTLVKGPNNKGIVMMPLDNSWKETLYLMSNPTNYERLKHSIEQAKNGKIEEHELVEI